MSISVGSMSAGLGLDLSEFQNGMKRATDLARSNSTLMSAEMKRTSREGAESLRLIDESLGIHISRPLTRILTQEFPAFAAGLQTVLGGAVFGALATIGIETIDKVVRSIEKAQKAQEEWKNAVEKTENVIESVGDSYARKIAQADGLTPIAQAAMAGADEAKKAFDEIATAIDNENKKAEEASGIWTRFKAGVGDFFHQQFTTDSGLRVEDLKAQLGTLKSEIDNAFRLDALHGTHDAMKVFQDDLVLATQKMKELQAQQAKQNTAFAFDVPGHTGPRPAQITPEQLAAVQQWIDLLNRAIGLEKQRTDLEKADLAAAARAEAAKQELIAQEKIAALYKEMGSSLAKLQPETDPIKKLDAEIEGFRATAEANFRAVGRSAASALATSAALSGLLSYEKKLDELKIKLEADILAKEALDLLNKPLPGGQPTGSSVPGLVTAPTPIAPILGSGGTIGAQLDTFAKDQAAQLKAAAAAYADIVTPAQKYQLTQQELNLLLQKGLIDQTAYTAAMQKAGEEMAKATDKLEKLLAKTGDASAGMQAFFLKLNQDAGQNGKFTFDILNKGLQGFEDNTVSMLMTGKANWQSYFSELTAMAMKFLLNKALSSLLGNLFGGALGGLFGGVGASGGGPPGFASGTDYTPGGMAWVGEQGPELLNLPKGSSVTPASAVRTGGDVHIHNYADQFRGAVVTDDLMRKADAVRMAQATRQQAVGEAMASFTEVQKRTLQAR